MFGHKHPPAKQRHRPTHRIVCRQGKAYTPLLNPHLFPRAVVAQVLGALGMGVLGGGQPPPADPGPSHHADMYSNGGEALPADAPQGVLHGHKAEQGRGALLHGDTLHDAADSPGFGSLFGMG